MIEKRKIGNSLKKDKFLILLLTDGNKLLMQWKSPLEVEKIVVLNDLIRHQGGK